MKLIDLSFTISEEGEFPSDITMGIIANGRYKKMCVCYHKSNGRTWDTPQNEGDFIPEYIFRQICSLINTKDGK